MDIYPVCGTQKHSIQSLDKGRARSKALRALGGCCCNHERHQAVGRLEESTKKGRADEAMDQTDVGVDAHLDVFPVKLNAPELQPRGGCRRT